MKRNWEYKKLGDVCDILDSKRKPVTKSNRKSGIYPYYGATGIQDYVDSYIFDGRYLLVGEDGAKWGKGDNSAFIIEGKSWVNNHAHILSVHEYMSDVFIRYFLNGTDLNSYITGAVVPKLTQAALVSIPIPVPPLEEQSRIVAELDLLTGIIDKQNAQLKELDNLAQAIFYDMFGDPIENPKRWEVKSLNELSEKIGDGLHGTPEYTAGEEFYFINGNNLNDGVIQITSSTQSVSHSEYVKYFIEFNERTVFVSINGTIGKIAFFAGEHVILGKSACYIILKKDCIIKHFLYGLLKSDFFFDYTHKEKTGSTISNVSLKSMRNMPVILPPLALQQSFAEKIQSIEKQKETIRASIADTQKLLDYTMDKYFG